MKAPLNLYFLWATLFIFPCCATDQANEHTYDLMSICNYKFTSTKEFINLPESDKCTRNIKNQNPNPFFSSYITSRNISTATNQDIGPIRIRNGKPDLAIQSYSDSARGVEQQLLEKKIISRDKSKFVAISLVSVVHPPLSTESQDGDDVEEFYECWHSLTFGKKTSVVAFLCDKKSQGEEIDLQSWQHELIDSITVR